MLHDIGMIRYGEAHEAIFATMGDGMEMKQSADVPMGAMWLANNPGEIEAVYFNDLQESASVAHIYGQNLTAAESLTGGPAFGSAPWDLKPTADAILLTGVNRFVIHTSTHQPVSKGPGMTLGVGQYFTRNETWAEQAKPWVDYLSRASFLLQQGRAANDIAVFYGEAGPVVASYREQFPGGAGGIPLRLRERGCDPEQAVGSRWRDGSRHRHELRRNLLRTWHRACVAAGAPEGAGPGPRRRGPDRPAAAGIAEPRRQSGRGEDYP